MPQQQLQVVYKEVFLKNIYVPSFLVDSTVNSDKFHEIF